MPRCAGPHRDPVLLVVSADALLRQALQTTLTASGFLVEVARTADDALSLIHGSHFDLVVLSIDLPEKSGLEVCRQMRSHASELGIVMVTERDSEREMVQSLEAGADDYVTRRFQFRELTARVRAVLRRTQTNNTVEIHVLRAGDLEVDLDRRLLRRAGKIVHLTPTEFDLLVFLMKNEGVLVTHSNSYKPSGGRNMARNLSTCELT